MATTKPRITIYVTKEQETALNDLSKLMGVSRTAVVQQAITQFILSYNILQKNCDISGIIKTALEEEKNNRTTTEEEEEEYIDV